MHELHRRDLHDNVLTFLQIWGHEHKWEKTLEYFSGYKLEAVSDLIARVHQMLLAPSHESKHTIKTKYSHRYVFSCFLKP